MALTKVHTRMINDGAVNVMDYGAVGDGTTIDTFAFNQAAAAAAGGNLFVPKQTGAYYLINNDILLQSNTIVTFEAGTVIQTASGTFGTGEAILKMNEVSNIVINGNGVVLKGSREGVHPNLISFGVAMTGAENIWIDSVYCEDHSGDGFMVAEADDNNPFYCKRIWMSNCVAYNNMRNGLSVLTCDGFWAENCVFKKSNGKEPEAGVDVEPSGGSSILKSIHFTNCEAVDNYRHNFMTVLGGNTTPMTDDVDIIFTGCIARQDSALPSGGNFGSSQSGTGFAVINHKPAFTSNGRLQFVNCTSLNTKGHGLYIRNIDKVSQRVEFYDMSIINCASVVGLTENSPFVLENNNATFYPNPGGVYIKGITITDDQARTPYYINSAAGQPWVDVQVIDIKFNNPSYPRGSNLPFMQAGTDAYISFVDEPWRFDRTSNFTVSSRLDNCVLTNNGASGAIIFTLPATSEKLNYTFHVLEAQTLQIDPNASDTIFPLGVSDGKYIQSNTKGSTIQLQADPDGDGWIIVSQTGTWTAEP